MYTSYTHTSNIDSLQVYISVSHEAHTQLKILQLLGPCYWTCINPWNLLTSCKENTQSGINNIKFTKLLSNLSLFNVSPLNLHHRISNMKRKLSLIACALQAHSVFFTSCFMRRQKTRAIKKLNCALTGQIALRLSRFCSQAS